MTLQLAAMRKPIGSTTQNCMQRHCAKNTPHFPTTHASMPAHRKAFMISSRLSRSPILAVIICGGRGACGVVSKSVCGYTGGQKQGQRCSHGQLQLAAA